MHSLQVQKQMEEIFKGLRVLMLIGSILVSNHELDRQNEAELIRVVDVGSYVSKPHWVIVLSGEMSTRSLHWRYH